MNESVINPMPRTRAPGRLQDILTAATDLFIAGGYRQTRIEDIAALARVAPATIHLYARTKEGLFDLVVRSALGDASVHTEELPYVAPASSELIERLWQRLNRAAEFPRLAAAGLNPPPEGGAAELEEIVGEFYDWLMRYHRAVKLIERCAREWPELAALFYKQFRRTWLDRLTTLLERRAAQGALRSTPDASVAARVGVEMVSFFAMHRHSAPDSDMDDARTRAVVIDMIVHALQPN
jgi:AcrR family transcriptional regulator